jgi:hypothetical protein
MQPAIIIYNKLRLGNIKTIFTAIVTTVPRTHPILYKISGVELLDHLSSSLV